MNSRCIVKNVLLLQPNGFNSKTRPKNINVQRVIRCTSYSRSLWPSYMGIIITIRLLKYHVINVEKWAILEIFVYNAVPNKNMYYFVRNVANYPVRKVHVLTPILSLINRFREWAKYVMFVGNLVYCSGKYQRRIMSVILIFAKIATIACLKKIHLFLWKRIC